MTTTWRATRPGDPVSDPRLRAGDADRETVAQILRNHHLEGRLSTDELQERIERAYQASTLGELDAVLADLPHDRPRVIGGGRGQRPWPMTAVSLFITLAVLCAATGHHLIWLAVPLLLIGRLVLRADRAVRWPGTR